MSDDYKTQSSFFDADLPNSFVDKATMGNDGPTEAPAIQNSTIAESVKRPSAKARSDNKIGSAEFVPKPVLSPAHACAYLSDKAVAARYGVSRPTVWRWTKTRDKFPSPVRISEGTSRWRLEDLISFEQSQLEDSKAETPTNGEQGKGGSK